MTYSNSSSSNPLSNGRDYSSYPKYTIEEIESRNAGLEYNNPLFTNEGPQELADISSYGFLPDGYLPDDFEYPDWWQELLDTDWNEVIDDFIEQLPGSNIEDILELIQCVGDEFQLEESVTSYEIDDLNSDEAGELLPQFEDCPDKQFFYESGWEYDDYRSGTFTGAIPAGVKRLRSCQIGVPLKTSTTESHNPGRINNLPPQASTMIHSEPVKIVWVHPFLERGDNGFKGKWSDDLGDAWEPSEDDVRETDTLAFSYYTEHWTWQSGPPSNSPTNSTITLESGFWTNAGGLSNSEGKDSVNAMGLEETRISVSREFYDYGKTNFRMGYSRGNDTILYGDSPTEGLEYGVVGMSGYVSALPNESWSGTNYNIGIQHLYTINRLNTSGEELKANITAFVKWLEHLATLIPDEGLPGMGDGDEGTFTIDPERSLSTVSRKEDEDFTDDQLEKLHKVIDRINTIQDYIKDKIDRKELNSSNTQKLFENGTFDRLKRIKFDNTQADINALSLLYEFAGRFSPRNADLKESQLNFDINPSHIFKKADNGEEVTALDIVKNFATRLILEDENLARQFGDLDLEKLGRYGAGLISEKEVRNEKFFIYLVHNQRDRIKAFNFDREGVVEVAFKNGFRWNAKEYLQERLGFLEACDRNLCDMFAEDGAIYAIRRTNDNINTSEGDPDGYAAVMYGDFEDSDITDNPWFEAETVPNEKRLQRNEFDLQARKDQHSGNVYTKNCLPPEPGDELVLYDNPGSSHIGEEVFQRWNGGYAYPAASNSARPQWGEWGRDNIASGYSNCPADKEWFVHTYGPFLPHEMECWYYFIIPLQRHQNPRMDYGLFWWFSDDPKGMPDKWNPSQGGAKNPLDAYSQWVKPDTPAAIKKKLENAWKVKCYYTIKPKKKYFRVAFYRWRHDTPYPGADGILQGQHGDQEIEHNSREKQGPAITSNLYPPMICGPKPPGTPDGDNPHGIFFPFIVTPKKDDNPYKEDVPKPPFKGIVYWTDEKYKVAELGNEHYKQPVNLFYSAPTGESSSRWLEITPIRQLDHELVKDQDTPMMSIHLTADDQNKAKDPQSNPGYRNRFSEAITYLRRYPVQIEVPAFESMSIAGWYPDDEIGGAKKGRTSVGQWSQDGEPWVKIKELTLNTADNGPGYLENSTAGKGPYPNFFSEWWQKPLNFWGDAHNKYQNPNAPNNKNVQTPIPGTRFKCKVAKKGNTEVNGINPSGPLIQWETEKPTDVYFCLDKRARNPYANPSVLTNPKPMFKYAGHIEPYYDRRGENGSMSKPLDYEMEFIITPPTDMMIFGHTAFGNTGQVVQPVDWGIDGRPVFIKAWKVADGPRDGMKGCGYWTGLGRDPNTDDIYKNEKIVGRNGYVDFHNMYWSNPITSFNDTRADGTPAIRAGQEYTMTYTVAPDRDSGHVSGFFKANEQHRVRLIFGKTSAASDPVYETDPGWKENGSARAGKKTIPDEVNYEFTDIILKPGVKTTFTALSNDLYMGVFNVSTTANYMGPMENWSRFGQPLNITIETKETIKGCSLWTSNDEFNGTQNTITNQTWKDLNRYKTPYTHLTKEISIYRNHKKDDIPGSYDGGTLPLVPGRKYRLSTTAWTPEYHYRIKHIKDEQSLGKNDLNKYLLPDHPDDNLHNIAIGPTPNLTEKVFNFIEFTAVSEFIMLEAWAVTDPDVGEDDDQFYPPYSMPRAIDDFSDHGEPAFLKLSYAEEGVIEGRQYWTDLNDPNDAKRAAVLKDKHWKSPLSYIKKDGRLLKANTTYEIEFIERDDNPDYLHELWIGPNPGAYQTGTNCSYTKGPSLRKGEKAEFKTGGKNVVPIIGCKETSGRTLESWNKDGEPIFYKLIEKYSNDPEGPVYPANLMDPARANWNQYTTDKITAYGEDQMFCNPILNLRDPEGEPDEAGDKPFKFTKINVVGEAATDVSPRIVPGQRYRIKYDSSLKRDFIPEDYEDELPYVLRVWETRNTAQIQPGVYEHNKLTGGRVYYPQHAGLHNKYDLKEGNYMDFIPTSSDILFGAAYMRQRAANEWSPKGEPINVKIEKLPAETSNGPSYPIDRDHKDRPPAIENEFFLKPINYMKVKPGSEVQFKPDPTLPPRFDRRIWWIPDRPTDTIQDNDTKNEVNSPLAFDPLHPEDVLLYDRQRGRYDFKWENRYIAGPEIVMGDDGLSSVITVPAGITKCLISVYPEAGYNPGMGPSRAGAYNQLDALLGMWGNNGEPINGQFVPYAAPPMTEGPVYWGDTTQTYPGTDRKKHKFLDDYWQVPRNAHKGLKANNRYKVTKATGRDENGEVTDRVWTDYSTVDIYAFTYGDMGGNSSDSDYKYVGTFNETDADIFIEMPRGYGDLIFSAYNMKGGANKKKMEDWSPKGDAHPFKFELIKRITGPVYWADDHNSATEVWQYGMPNFSNNKWKEINYHVFEVDATYEMKLKKALEYGIFFWWTDDLDALDPSKSKKNMWEENDDLPGLADDKQMKLGDTIDFVAEKKYLVFGCVRTTGRSFKDWSPYGEPDPFSFKMLPFPKGPGYPAMEWQTAAHVSTTPTLNHKRFNDPITTLVPKGNIFFDFNAFIIACPYKFKYKGKTMERHYDMQWFSQGEEHIGPGDDGKRQYKMNFEKRIINTKTFSARAQRGDVIFSIRSKTGSPFPRENSPSMSKWSPQGHPVPIKASIDWMELIPKNWWKYLLALLFLLAAMIALYAYLRATAPMDVLVQMDEEHEGNEYPIHRYERLYDDEGKPYGYGYPYDMKLLEGTPVYKPGLGMHPPEEGFSWCKDWDTKPKFFNYTADYLVRAWARIMKLRHNGYMVHTTRNVHHKREDLIQDDFTDKHVMTFANVSQTYGMGFSKLNAQTNLKFKKVFREYKAYPADRNVNRYNPYDFTGVRVIKVDSSTDPLKQQPQWNNDMEWFDADHQFIHYAKQDTMVESMGGAKYKVGEGISPNYKKLAFPGYQAYGQRAIFCDLGFSISNNFNYTNFSSSHNVVWEVINGDETANYDNWPGVLKENGFDYVDESIQDWTPGIEFDLINKFGDIQLNQVHVNFEKRFMGEIYDRTAIKMVVDTGSAPYTLRDTNDNTTPKADYDQGSVDKIKLIGSSVVSLGEWRFTSISFCYSVGTKANGSSRELKDFGIKNLKSYFTYNKVT